MRIVDQTSSEKDIIYNNFGIISVQYSTQTSPTTLNEEYSSTDYEEPNSYIVLDSLTYVDPYHDFDYKTYELLRTPFDHYINWWDWKRTGKLQQISRKKKIFKHQFFCKNNFWRKILPSKSGYIGKEMKRRKGK
jgi:hypothetical protein